MHVQWCVMSALPRNVEDIHPALWRGSQLARATGRTVDTGYAALSAQLPGGGWPIGTLIELLVAHPGIGEMRLLRPALAAPSTRSIALVQPPHVPHAHAYAYFGIDLARPLWIRTAKSADALWSAEQILRTGSCSALVLWQNHIRAESLRRLLLAAQSAETLFFVMRPLASAPDASPATLRLGIRSVKDGISVELIKRKGPAPAEPLWIPMLPSPILLSPHRRVREQVDVAPATPEELAREAS
jgi:protein ImuA